jgi:tRNA1(Val) A37 N6-methylase TrmN6
MSQYTQPSFYHFSEDSLLAVHYIASKYAIKETIASVLDFGCGCGVMGIELASKLQNIEKLVLHERQKEFEPYLNQNIQSLNIRNFCQVEVSLNELGLLRSKFEVVISNPPYYREGTVRVSPHPNTAICKTISDEKSWLNQLVTYLAPEGTLFCLFPRETKNPRWYQATQSLSEIESQIVELRSGASLMIARLKRLNETVIL